MTEATGISEGQGSTPAPSPRTQVRRHRDRGAYDRQTVYRILDEGWLCHLAVSDPDGGAPVVLPTLYARDGEWLYIHGAAANSLMRRAASGAEVTVCVTLVDGLVLARSVFNHSINYRSVVIYGSAEAVTDPDAKYRALIRVADHFLPGRSGDARPPNPTEMKATLVLRVHIDEASAKVRRGQVVDEPEDVALPVWAGVLPLHTRAGVLEAAPDTPVPLDVPEYLLRTERWGAAGQPES
jgi:nitroimidazol reductase NimA-like FMN-containing flavoprotein (pyridoxamine 5'-phosphate oxidase superfamily)